MYVDQREGRRDFASFGLPLDELRPLIECSAIVPPMPVASDDSPVRGFREVGSKEVGDGCLLGAAEAIDKVRYTCRGAIRVMMEHGDLGVRCGLMECGETIGKPLESSIDEIVKLCARPRSFISGNIQGRLARVPIQTIVRSATVLQLPILSRFDLGFIFAIQGQKEC